MRDDELMDQLLRETLSDAPPTLSPDFDARLMRRVRPRRLSRKGRLLLAAYAAVAAIMVAWLMRDLQVVAILAAVASTVPIAIGAGAYGRRIAIPANAPPSSGER